MKMVCIKKGQWVSSLTGEPVMQRSPNYGEIVTVAGINKVTGGFYLVEYAENREGTNYRRSFTRSRFRPIVPDEPKASTEKFDFRQHLKQDA